MTMTVGESSLGEGPSALSTSALRTERLVTARGILVPQPEFTWELSSSKNDQRQTACEIEVNIVPPVGDVRSVWRSGKLSRLIGEEIHYVGEPLLSRGVYQWRVRVWDAEDKASAWSEWTTFEMGILSPDRLEAEWITGGGMVRGTSAVKGEVARARAYVSGLGYYEFFCNGKKVSDGALAPSFTEFEKRVEYEIIDLKPNLRAGENAFGFMLGDGWWRHHNQKKLQAIAQIVIDYADGRRELFSTDLSWLGTSGPIIQDAGDKNQQIFDGVVYDCRLLDPSWCQPGFKAKDWQPVAVATETKGQLVPSLLPAMRITETIPAVSIGRLEETKAVIDFGQNFAGWMRVRAWGPEGTRLVFRYAELLYDDGTVNQENLRGAKATDTFILKGEPNGEVLEPHFTYHGFRYVQVEGPHAGLDPESILGCVVHSDVAPTLELTSANDQLNWLLTASRWTLRSNLHSVPTDCPQRDERRGWLLDGLLGLHAGAGFFDMDTFCRKWFDDMTDIQESDGSLLSDSAPSWPRVKSIGWQQAVALVPMRMYQRYGDLRFLKAAYPAMKRYADYLLEKRIAGNLAGDESPHSPEWLCLGHKLKALPDNALVYEILQTVASAATVLGFTDDAPRFEKEAEGLAQRFHKRWYSTVCGGYEAGTFFAQSNQVYPLRYGMVPAEEKAAVFDRLLDDLLNARGPGPYMTTGLGSTTHLLEVLSENGRDDLAWALIQREEYPSWGFMRHHGATTIWERWEKMTYNSMNSHNHPAYAGVAGWVFQYVAGFEVVPGATPLFRLRPAVQLPIPWLKVKWKSRWGTFTLSWEKQDDVTTLNIQLPPGCLGELRLANQPELISLASGLHQIIL